METRLLQIEERIAQIGEIQSFLENAAERLDKEWESLIVERAKIETEIEKCD